MARHQPILFCLPVSFILSVSARSKRSITSFVPSMAVVMVMVISVNERNGKKAKTLFYTQMPGCTLAINEKDGNIFTEERNKGSSDQTKKNQLLDDVEDLVALELILVRMRKQTRHLEVDATAVSLLALSPLCCHYFVPQTVRGLHQLVDWITSQNVQGCCDEPTIEQIKPTNELSIRLFNQQDLHVGARRRG